MPQAWSQHVPGLLRLRASTATEIPRRLANAGARRRRRECADTGRGRRFAAEPASSDEEHRGGDTAAGSNRDARLQQGGRQHIPEPAGGAGGLHGEGAARLLLAQGLRRPRRLPLDVEGVRQARLRVSLRRGCSLDGYLQLPQGGLRA